MRQHTGVDDIDRFDHSDHPTHRSCPDDLAVHPGGETRPAGEGRHIRGGVPQTEPVTPPDAGLEPASVRRKSEDRAVD
jgi:hypothetical protein